MSFWKSLKEENAKLNAAAEKRKVGREREKQKLVEEADNRRKEREEYQKQNPIPLPTPSTIVNLPSNQQFNTSSHPRTIQPCPLCGCIVSRQANQCPRCGHPIMRGFLGKSGTERVFNVGCLVVIVVIGALAILGAFSRKPSKARQSSPTGKFVTKESDGETWAFTVDSGYIYSESGAAIFENGGTQYGINGTAKAMGYAPVDSIWRVHPESTTGQRKIDMGPYIQAALANPK